MSPSSAVATAPQAAHPKSEDLQHLADADLLARFFHSHDDVAFAVLLARHGPLVLGVCQRILGNSTDAEDAFQATFLVLVSKGSTLRQPARLANWLFGVAYRTARKLRAKAVLRTKRERQASEVSTTTTGAVDVSDMTYQELQTILDEEISRLPQKYAMPLVLCYLEGKTNAEAAAQLGWPEGSMSRRLSRARELLRSRLARRGLAITAALILAVFSRRAAASVPEHLLASTVEAGSRVVKGAPVKEVASPIAAVIVAEVIAAMSTTSKLTISAAVAVALLAVTLAGFSLHRAAPAFGAGLFQRGNTPHGYTIGPDGAATLSTSGGGGCGSAPVSGCMSQSGCGSTP